MNIDLFGNEIITKLSIKDRFIVPPLLANCCYTLFSFVTLSFNPFNWQEITRAFYVVLLVIIDFSILTAPKDLFE